MSPGLPQHAHQPIPLVRTSGNNCQVQCHAVKKIWPCNRRVKYLCTRYCALRTSLSYICRPASAILPTTVNGDFIDEYVDKVTLTGQAYLTDAVEVHTYIIKFTSGIQWQNPKWYRMPRRTTEDKISSH